MAAEVHSFPSNKENIEMGMGMFSSHILCGSSSSFNSRLKSTRFGSF